MECLIAENGCKHDGACSGAGFLWRNRYKSDFFPSKVPVNPPPLEQVGTGSSATLFSDFDEVLRKWITKDAEWKAYYRERRTANRPLFFTAPSRR